MTWRTICVLWVLAALVWIGGWFLWSVSVDSRAVQMNEGFAPVFPAGSVPWSRIERIEISRGPNDRFEFVRRDGRWFQSAPFEFPMDGARLMEVVDQATGLTARIASTDGATETAEFLESTGLGANAPSVTLAWNDGGAVTVRLGRRLPAGFAWIDLGGEHAQPRAARSALHDAALLNDLRQWRQTLLFSRADVDCDRLVCESAGRDGALQRLEIVRDGSAWKVVSPIATRADRAAVERWLEALARAQASGFVVDRPIELMPFGLDTPSGIVEIHASMRKTDADGRVSLQPMVERLEIGAPIRAGASERFARLTNQPEAIMEIDGTAVAAAIPPTLLMIDPTATGQRPSDVRAIRLEPVGGEALRIERLGSDWNMADVSGIHVAMVGKVDALLGKLCDSRAAEIMLSAAPADLVVGRIVLESFDGREISSIMVSRERNDGRFGVDDGSGVLRIFPPSLGLRFDAASYAIDDAGAIRSVPSAVPVP